MDKIKKDPKLIVILAILLVSGVALAQKFNSVVKPTVGDRVLADEREDSNKVSEADDEKDENQDEDKDENKDENKNDDEDKDEDKNSGRSKLKTQKVEDDEDEADDQDENDDLDDENDNEDETGEEIKDISELIAKVERKISLVASSGGSVNGFKATLAEVRDLVAQTQAKLAEGDKSGAENLIETADDKLENLEESVKLVLGEREDDDEDEANDDDEDKSKIAKEYKNSVAQFVHDLKATAELDGVKEGLGRQVSIVAQIQNASQERVAELLGKIDDRSEFKKFFVGPNLNDLNGIKEEIAKNQGTIQVLTQILGQTDNANVKIVLQRQIQVLEQENLKLQNYIATAENVPSLFGWLARLFS